MIKPAQFDQYKDKIVVEFKGVEDQYKKIREDLKLYLTTKQYKSETTKLVQEFEFKFVDTEDLMKKLKIQNDKHSQTQVNIEELKNTIEEFEDKLVAQKMDICSIITQEVKNLNYVIANYALYDDLRDLYNKVLPPTEHFRGICEIMT